MKYFTAEELRDKFLKFFEKQGHLVEKSYNLIPKDDDSILLIGAGMAPLKKYFMGLVTPPNVRMATCQKCVRVGDLDNVGVTARHLTFFEMLGNFSFADYFKKESLKWGIEFLTEELEIPLDRLWVSVYEEDDESYDIWKDYLNFPEERIVRLGKDDNFWEIGEGPCGPCSEIYFDRGEKYSCGNKDHKPGCECDQFIEVWNHVFTQFNKNTDGTYSNLKNKNIDTGMGLERLAVVMQEKDNVFEIDTFQPLIEVTEEITSKKYGVTFEDDKSMRIIADHIRGITFMVGDGVIPSNESRGYILRKLLRRASLQFIKLGYEDLALTKVAKKVIDINKGHYTLLAEREEIILNMIENEEKKFHQTITRGLSFIKDIMKNSDKKVIDGSDVFKLYDTFGFPVEITEEIAKENGFEVDLESFKVHMEQQKRRAKESVDNSSKAWQSDVEKELTKLEPTKFTGYSSSKETSKILKIVVGNELVDSCKSGDEVIIVTEVTPFYATSGGQVGDSGTISYEGKTIDINNTEKVGDIFVHFGKANGDFKVDDDVLLEVDAKRRKNISRNHSATHLLNQALCDMFGDTISQAGSYVDEYRLRFDYTYFKSLSEEEIRQLEMTVNNSILNGLEVNANVYDINEAKKMGAKALFTEKYGKEVRVIKMGDYSVEFCGGIHVNSTSEIGMFKIVSEKAVASGVRRIEAITGLESVKKALNEYDTTKSITDILKTQRQLIIEEVTNLRDKNKLLQKEIDKLKDEISRNETRSLDDIKRELGDINFYYKVFDNKSNDDLKKMSDDILSRDDNGATLFISKLNGKLLLLSAARDKAVNSGYKSGKVISQVARMLGGGGGGRDTFASAGAKDVSKLSEVDNNIDDIVKEIISN